jgi:predicted O-methyltransferase YrrM
MVENKVLVEDLVNYHVKDFIIENELFQQVYEEILALAYWAKGFQPHNILEIGHRGSTFHILSQLSTGKKVAVDYVDNGLSIRDHYMMYGQDFRLFIGDSQEEETRDKVKEFCPQYDLIFIDGDHSYEGVKRDFDLYKTLLSPRGHIIFHDIDPENVFKDEFPAPNATYGAGQVFKFWQDLEEGTKTNLIATKSSGKIKAFGCSEHFGGIGIWRPQ